FGRWRQGTHPSASTRDSACCSRRCRIYAREALCAANQGNAETTAVAQRILCAWSRRRHVVHPAVCPPLLPECASAGKPRGATPRLKAPVGIRSWLLGGCSARSPPCSRPRGAERRDLWCQSATICPCGIL